MLSAVPGHDGPIAICRPAIAAAGPAAVDIGGAAERNHHSLHDLPSMLASTS